MTNTGFISSNMKLEPAHLIGPPQDAGTLPQIFLSSLFNAQLSLSSLWISSEIFLHPEPASLKLSKKLINANKEARCFISSAKWLLAVDNKDQSVESQLYLACFNSDPDVLNPNPSVSTAPGPEREFHLNKRKAATWRNADVETYSNWFIFSRSY